MIILKSIQIKLVLKVAILIDITTPGQIALSIGSQLNIYNKTIYNFDR